MVCRAVGLGQGIDRLSSPSAYMVHQVSISVFFTPFPVSIKES